MNIHEYMKAVITKSEKVDVTKSTLTEALANLIDWYLDFDEYTIDEVEILKEKEVVVTYKDGVLKATLPDGCIGYEIDINNNKGVWDMYECQLRTGCIPNLNLIADSIIQQMIDDCEYMLDTWH